MAESVKAGWTITLSTAPQAVKTPLKSAESQRLNGADGFEQFLPAHRRCADFGDDAAGRVIGQQRRFQSLQPGDGIVGRDIDSLSSAPVAPRLFQSW